MSMSTTQLAERFGCVSMTLEMPFKDNFDLPDEVYGWSPERSKYLAVACLDSLHAILPELKAAQTEKAQDARRSRPDADARPAAPRPVAVEPRESLHRLVGRRSVATRASPRRARPAGCSRTRGFDFDRCFTSVQTRAIRTLHLVLHEMDRLWLPVTKDWRLNERHYGGLTGLNKQEMIDKVGAEQVKIWRRSFDIPPPPLPADSPYFVGGDRRYAGIDVPATESLKDTIERVLPYFEAEIAPRADDAASGSSSRPTAIRCARWKSICRTSAMTRSSAWKSRPASRSSTSLATTCRSSDRYYLSERSRSRPQTSYAASLSRYIASSARSMTASGESPCSIMREADGDAERQAGALEAEFAPATWSTSRAGVSHALFSSAWSSRMANSSPPIRATISVWRTLATIISVDMDQRRVAGRMAEGVVERLEAVDIDEQQRRRRAVALEAGRSSCPAGAISPRRLATRHQRVHVGQPVELLDPRLRAAPLRPANARFQRSAPGVAQSRPVVHVTLPAFARLLNIRDRAKTELPACRLSQIAPPARLFLNPALTPGWGQGADGRAALVGIIMGSRPTGRRCAMPPRRSTRSASPMRTRSSRPTARRSGSTIMRGRARGARASR